jgi:isocitrate lyase
MRPSSPANAPKRASTGSKAASIAPSRGIAYADRVWCETSTPSLADARRFAEAVRKVQPEQMLAYNCSPSFNWAKHMDKAAMKHFQRELGAMGYKYQFIILAGFHN